MTMQEEMTQVAAGVNEQVGVQLQPGMRCMTIIGAPDGTFVVASNFEKERAIKVLQRALDSLKGGQQRQEGLIWLPPGVRA